MTDHTNDPTLESWVKGARDTDFPIQNLPLGIFSTSTLTPRAGMAIGEYIVDLSALYEKGFLDGLDLGSNVFAQPVLNSFLAGGHTRWSALRRIVSDLLAEGNEQLRPHEQTVLVPQSMAKMHLPLHIPDYTDFYSSMEHASNVGKMFRPNMEALLPNWKHLPVGYHGRASSIVVSGTDFHRPCGQTMKDGDERPEYGPTKQLDIELEMAFVIGQATDMGRRIPTGSMRDFVYGLSLFNDWSARDIQRWEYVPLGPFLGKNFASSLAPWIVSLDALEPFRVDGPVQDPEVLDYLKTSGAQNYDIVLEVYLTPQGGEPSLICTSNHKYLYWNIAQQLAHHTVNGCPVSVGDVYASGTISAPDENGFGSMLELSWKGTKPIQLKDGSTRTFLLDHDTITIKGYCQGNGYRIGFGEVTGTVLPALP